MPVTVFASVGRLIIVLLVMTLLYPRRSFERLGHSIMRRHSVIPLRSESVTRYVGRYMSVVERRVGIVICVTVVGFVAVTCRDIVSRGETLSRLGPQRRF